MLLGVIRTADKWAGLDIPEAHVHSYIVEFFEFVGMQKAANRKMIRGRLQVLSECENINFHFN
jgi:hypothetical protein